jgi:DNA-binding CsgD family transcriptional regulator
MEDVFMATHSKPFVVPSALLVGMTSTGTEISHQANVLEDLQLAIHLLSLGQVLCGQMQSGINRLCSEVRLSSCGRAYLSLGRQRIVKKNEKFSTALLSQPVQFGNLVYGTLCVTADPLCAETPSIALPVVHLLTQVCGWLLYTIEQSSFLQGQCQRLDYQINGVLTRREREVLALMCQGSNQEEIAELLCISPATVSKHRQHIYEQLGVHCERDALLVAYQTGIFSLINDQMT